MEIGVVSSNASGTADPVNFSLWIKIKPQVIRSCGTREASFHASLNNNPAPPAEWTVVSRISENRVMPALNLERAL